MKRELLSMKSDIVIASILRVVMNSDFPHSYPLRLESFFRHIKLTRTLITKIPNFTDNVFTSLLIRTSKPFIQWETFPQ